LTGTSVFASGSLFGWTLIIFIIATATAGASCSFCFGFENEIDEVLFAHRRETTKVHLLRNVFEFRKLFVLKVSNFHVVMERLPTESHMACISGKKRRCDPEMVCTERTRRSIEAVRLGETLEKRKRRRKVRQREVPKPGNELGWQIALSRTFGST